MKRKFKFKDAEGTVFYVDAEIKTKDGKQRFSVSGSYTGGAGQCYECIKPANKAQKKLVEIWKTYHINDMNSGTVKQSAIVDKYFRESGKRYNYTEACKILQGFKKVDGEPVSMLWDEHESYVDAVYIAEKGLKQAKQTFSRVKKAFSGLEYGKWVRVDTALYDSVILHNGAVKSKPYKNQLFFENGYSLERVKKLTLGNLDKAIEQAQTHFHSVVMQSFLWDAHPETGEPYKYGSGWLTYPLPENFESELSTITEELDDTELESSPAKQFLRDTETEFSLKFKKNGCYFEDDNEARDIWLVTLKREKGEYTFTFGQSIAHAGKKPTEYDVLACLEGYNPGSLEDFCDNYGYDIDSKKAERIYTAVDEQYKELEKLFNEEELEKLTEIN